MPFDTFNNYASELQKNFNQAVGIVTSNVSQAASFVEKEFNNLITSYSNSLDGATDWVKKFIYGEFADNRPVSVIVTEMLVGFVPGTVLVFSARDSVAVASRMISNPSKQEDIQEWMLLGVYLLPFVLVGATAVTGAAAGGAGGAVAAGAGAAPGAAVGGILGGAVGSEIGNVAKCVGLFMIQKTPQLAPIVNKLNVFMKGNVITTLKKLKFSEYAESVTKVISLLLNQLLGLVKRVKEVLSYGAKINWMGLGWAKSIYDRMVKFETAITSMIQKSAIKIKQAFKEFDEHLQKIINQSTKLEPVPATVGVPVRPVTPPTTVVRPSFSHMAGMNSVQSTLDLLNATRAKLPKNVHQSYVKILHKPKCFKIGDQLSKNPKWSKDRKGLEKEYDRQLQGQENGINDMTAGEFIDNLDKFDPKNSRSLSKTSQNQTREQHQNDIASLKEVELLKSGVKQPHAATQAEAHAKSVMKTMAALHNPDMSAGGGINTNDIGDKGVNSSIGSQWSKEERVAKMRAEAEKIKAAEGANSKMSVKLTRCK